MASDISVINYVSEFFFVEKIGNKIAAFALLTLILMMCKRFFRGEWLSKNVLFLLMVGLLAGMVLRIAWVLWVPHGPVGEEGYFFRHAQELAQGKGFVEDGMPSARRSIGYCLFLSLFYLGSDHPEVWMRVAHALLSASVGLVLFLLGRAIQGPSLGLLASYLWAFFPTAIFASSLVLDEHLCLPLLLLGLYFALLHQQNGKWRYVCYSGLSLGLGALARPIPSVLPVAIFLCFWITKFSLWEAMKRTALIGVLIVLCATPWAIRNWIKLGSPVSQTDVQVGFYYANNSFYDVRFPINPIPKTGEDPEIAQARVLIAKGTSREAVYYSKLAQKVAWTWICQNPGLFVKKTIGKACHLLGFSKEEWAVSMNLLVINPGRSLPPGWVIEWALIKSQNWFYILAFLGAVWGVFVFLIQWVRGKKNAGLILMFLAAGQVFLITILYLAHLKYRYMLDPFILIFTSYYFISITSLSNADSSCQLKVGKVLRPCAFL